MNASANLKIAKSNKRAVGVVKYTRVGRFAPWAILHTTLASSKETNIGKAATKEAISKWSECWKVDKSIGQRKEAVTDTDRAAIGRPSCTKTFLICMYITYCFDTFIIAKLKIAKHQNMTETQYFMLAKICSITVYSKISKLIYPL